MIEIREDGVIHVATKKIQLLLLLLIYTAIYYILRLI